MNAQGAFRAGISGGQNIVEAYLKDLSDAELLVRAVPGTNHIAWQLGHLIGAEYHMISQVADQVEMTFPRSWPQKYSRETASIDDPAHFEPKDRYLELYAAQRQATLDLLEALPEEQLAEPVPESFQVVVNTVGELFLFQAHHVLMHAGQFTCIRRKLGKPVLF